MPCTHKRQGKWGWGDGSDVKSSAALADDLTSVPSAHVVHKHLKLQIQGVSDGVSWFVQVPDLHKVHMDLCRQTSINTKQKNHNFKENN